MGRLVPTVKWHSPPPPPMAPGRSKAPPCLWAGKAQERPCRHKQQDEGFILYEQRGAWVSVRGKIGNTGGNALPHEEGATGPRKQQRETEEKRCRHRLTSLALALPKPLAVDDGECQKHQYDDDQGAAGQGQKGRVLRRYGWDRDLHQVCSGLTCKHTSHKTLEPNPEAWATPPACPSSRAGTVPPPAGPWDSGAGWPASGMSQRMARTRVHAFERVTVT